MPGTYQAVYNGTKAFLDSFAYALGAELKGSGVTVTCLMPGATETEFFDRADMMDTSVGTSKKDDAGKVARDGWDAMIAGDAHIVSGWKNQPKTKNKYKYKERRLASKEKLVPLHEVV